MSNPTVTDKHGTVWTWTGEIWRSDDGREMYTEQLRDQRGPCRSTPQIIRSIETAHGRHADSIIMSDDGAVGHGREASEWDLPAVVVVTDEHVRACREALTDATGQEANP